MRPDVVNASDPARLAMKPETVAPPFCRILIEIVGTCGSSSATAIGLARAPDRARASSRR